MKCSSWPGETLEAERKNCPFPKVNGHIVTLTGAQRSALQPSPKEEHVNTAAGRSHADPARDCLARGGQPFEHFTQSVT